MNCSQAATNFGITKDPLCTRGMLAKDSQEVEKIVDMRLSPPQFNGSTDFNLTFVNDQEP